MGSGTENRGATLATVVIHPGYDDSGPDHWQSLWHHTHPEYVRIRQRDWPYPACDEWVATLEHTLSRLAPPFVLVAHSLGCLTIAHWALRYHDSPTVAAVHAALLVAPPDIEALKHSPDPAYASLPEFPGFTPHPKIRLPFASVVVSSTNDPWCPQSRARELAAAWGSRFIDAGPRQHINTVAGFGPWPEGERLLAELLT